MLFRLADNLRSVATKVCEVCCLSQDVSKFRRFKPNPDGLNRYYEKCRRAGKHRPSILLMDRLREYGLKKATYEAMIAAQDNRCAICSRPPAPTKSLCIDHCHQTGATRSLLCPNCNSGLGRFGESIDFLRRAGEYLQKPRTVPKALPVIQGKVCTRCLEDKPLSSFPRWESTKNKRGVRCLECREEFKLPLIARQRLSQYKLTVRAYEAMLNEQGTACAICRRPQERLYIDHCHTTQITRGILCLDCNLGIGLFGDSCSARSII